MKNILLLTDFSENSFNAITYALQFYKQDKCTFYLIHIHKTGSFTSDNLMLSSSGSIYDTIVSVPKQKLKTLAAKLEKEFHNTNHTFETIIDFDVFTDAINQVVKLKNIELIILGSNGATGIKEVIFGSNTLNVIRKVDCTTLIIPEDYKYKQINELLLPLDSKQSLKRKIFSQIKNYTNTNDLKLHVLRIIQHNEDLDGRINDESFLEDTPCIYQIINDVPIHHAVNSYLQTFSIGIMALIVHKESLFERFIHGSTTTKISNSLKVPLLVFHSH